jgi:esterase/lipase superfamily enzyme
VVQVFYGTDRQAIEPRVDTISVRVTRFLPAGVGLLMTLALGLVAAASRRRPIWILAGTSLLVTVGLVTQALWSRLDAIRHVDHEGLRYTTARNPNGEVQVGVCDVTIPKSHQVGELESPSILRLEIKEDVRDHVTVRKIERLADEPFYAQLAARVNASPNRELFVFVHGFNVSFEDAARRTAQIHSDLKFAGAPVFFSWPAHDKFILTYNADANNVSWCVDHLKKFLLDVTHRSGAKSVNLIAHSMGNRALTTALKELQLEFREESRLFNQVILAAPDIDANEFKTRIAPGMTRTANRITLYASARDEALAASQFLHLGPRAGDAGRGLVVLDGIDTIDVTQIDTSPWGHTYYGSSDPVLRDLGHLLMRSAAPAEREWLQLDHLDGRPYWRFLRDRAASARLPGSEAR